MTVRDLSARRRCAPSSSVREEAGSRFCKNAQKFAVSVLVISLETLVYNNKIGINDI